MCRDVAGASCPRRSTRQYARAGVEELPEIFPAAGQSERASSAAWRTLGIPLTQNEPELNIAAHEGNEALKLAEFG